MVGRTFVSVGHAGGQEACATHKVCKDPSTQLSEEIRPMLDKVDVIVVGGGTAGAVAALAAARNGAATAIVEREFFLGGSQTGGLVVPMMPNHCDGKPLCTGISDEVFQTLRETGSACGRNLVNFDPEALKLQLERMVGAAGVKIVYGAQVTGVAREGPNVSGIAAQYGATTLNLAAKVVIDCTGDAHVAALTGVPCREGRASDGLHQAISLRFVMSGVEMSKFSQFIRELDRGRPNPSSEGIFHTAYTPGTDSPLSAVVERAVCDGLLTREDAIYLQMFSIPGRGGDVAFNCPELRDVDPLDPWELSAALLVGRQKIARLVSFFKERVAGFRGAYVTATACVPNIREGRCIEGDYTLSAKDYRAARKFPDAVARNAYPLDIHAEHPYVSHRLGEGEYHEIPYRCLLPRGVENLLVAGRCISAEFEAQSAIRIQPVCQALGQAAGTAAALAVSQQVTPRQLDARLLREALRRQGANV